MPEDSRTDDPGTLWRDQPAERLPVNLNRRTRELYSSTRAEILMSLGAALLLVAIVAWRFATERARIPLLLPAAVVAWVLISLYWFRDRIWRKPAPSGEALAATGLEHYRRELERRRDHLHNEWLWHGPLVLACAMLAAIMGGDLFFAFRRLESVVPLVALLALWTGFGVWSRRRQAGQLQREIDDMTRPQ
jgi:CHASE2 domain-containing sensor protein